MKINIKITYIANYHIRFSQFHSRRGTHLRRVWRPPAPPAPAPLPAAAAWSTRPWRRPPRRRPHRRARSREAGGHRGKAGESVGKP